MRAFLSHSSKDKAFVREVAKELGETRCEYDEKTFELTLNTKAIRNALGRSQIFVLFLSQHTISSTFVTEEERAALENRAKGLIKRVMVFALDHTTYRSLPDWLREINVAHHTVSAKACARRIQSKLIELEAGEANSRQLYIGRESDEVSLRKSLSAPPKETPISLHVVGHQGIGRRTFLRHSLQKSFPRLYDTILEISAGQYQGIADLYRSIYQLHIASSLEQSIKDFEEFDGLDADSQIALIAEYIEDMAQEGESILIVDDNGVYDEEGDYQPHFKMLQAQLQRASRPILLFAQTRMMPLSKRVSYERVHHAFLRPLADTDIAELMGLSLKQYGVSFTAEQLKDVCDHLDGHPYNVRFSAKYISEYGIDGFLSDPSDLIEWKRRRAEDFIKKVKFSDVEIDIMAVLHEYRFMSTEALVAILDAALEVAARGLRKLEEHCCIERREAYYHISAPIREAVRRDDRFRKSEEWQAKIAAAICDVAGEYKSHDSGVLPIVDAAVIAALRGAKAPSFVSHFILPSHLLRIARDSYDRGQRKSCIEFCEKAYAMRRQLPPDAQVEVLRLWGLSAARLSEAAALNQVLKELAGMPSRVARRVAYFVEGFSLRLKGLLDKAEERFLEAWKIAPKNQSINRELASLYCKQRRYSEAEVHARSAHEVSPTNPFIIDILVETLLGKMADGMPVDKSEFNELMRELKEYGDAPGSSFYLVRMAQETARAPGKRHDALGLLTRAIERTPALVAPYFIRADILLKAGDTIGAEKDVEKINELLTASGGFSEGEESQLQELEVRILIEKRQFRAAKDKIERSALLPNKVSLRLLNLLARTIGYDPTKADRELVAWSKNYETDRSVVGNKKGYPRRKT